MEVPQQLCPAMAAGMGSATYPESAAAWEAHRETITRLYMAENKPLKDVQRIMEDQYRFKATKRMYNNRINKWHINKHYKAREKDVLAAQIAQAYLQNLEAPELTLYGRPVKVHRIARHCKAVKKRTHSENRLESASLSPSPQTDLRRKSRNLSAEQTSPRSTTADMKTLSTPTTNYTPQSSSNVSPTISSQSEDNVSGTLDLTADQSLTIRLRIPSPAIPLSWPTDKPNLEAILQSIRAYYSWYFERLTTAETGAGAFLLPSVLGTAPKDNNALQSKKLNSIFWNKIKSAVYFLKVKSTWLAWPLLNEACGMATKVIDRHDLAFLSDIFATISPTNTAVCPEVRKHLLQFLAATFKIKFGPSHPFLTICHNLQMDSGCQRTSETALRYMADVFEEYFDPHHSEVFRLKRSLITLCRRGKDLDTAEASATALVKATETRRGTYDERTRTAMRELAHIYMDQLRYEEAVNICTDVLGRGHRGLLDTYPDARCVYTMEDLAQIYLYQGQTGQEIAWLSEALRGALKVFGKDAATMHILEKLEDKLIVAGLEGEAVAVRREFDQA